jgi:hypothetical protein
VKHPGNIRKHPETRSSQTLQRARTCTLAGRSRIQWGDVHLYSLLYTAAGGAPAPAHIHQLSSPAGARALHGGAGTRAAAAGFYTRAERREGGTRLGSPVQLGGCAQRRPFEPTTCLCWARKCVEAAARTRRAPFSHRQPAAARLGGRRLRAGGAGLRQTSTRRLSRSGG